MLLITKEQRNQAFASASPIQQALYADGKYGTQLLEIAQRFGLTDEDGYRTFSLTIGDFVLGFYPPSELQTTISQVLPASASQELVSAVKKFLSPMEGQYAPANHTVSELLTISSDIAETEAALEQLHEVRTMETDIAALGEAMNEETPVYTSTQAALLHERVPVAPPGMNPVERKHEPIPPPTLIQPTESEPAPRTPLIKRSAEMPRWKSDSEVED